MSGALSPAGSNAWWHLDRHLYLDVKICDIEIQLFKCKLLFTVFTPRYFSLPLYTVSTGRPVAITHNSNNSINKIIIAVTCLSNWQWLQDCISHPKRKRNKSFSIIKMKWQKVCGVTEQLVWFTLIIFLAKSEELQYFGDKSSCISEYQKHLGLARSFAGSFRVWQPVNIASVLISYVHIFCLYFFLFSFGDPVGIVILFCGLHV